MKRWMPHVALPKHSWQTLARALLESKDVKSEELRMVSLRLSFALVFLLALALFSWQAQWGPSEPDGSVSHVARPNRVAMFLQIHNVSLWPALLPCMENVLKAVSSVKLYAITTSEENVEKLKAFTMQLKQDYPSLSGVVVSLGVNKGADLGLFLQQLQLYEEMNFEVLLKIHSKRKAEWRGLAVDPLCGSVAIVQKNVARLQNGSVGMIGPSGLTWGPKARLKDVLLKLGTKGYNEVAMQGMEAAWSLISPNTKLPKQKHWKIAAGSCFWVSRRHMKLWESKLFPAIPSILGNLSTGYKTGCDKAGDFSCLVTVGLERILPTLIQISGSVVEAEAQIRYP